MAEQLTPTQLGAIGHWRGYGQRGIRPGRRATVYDWQTRGFIRPQQVAWDVKVEPHQLPVLLLGFLPSTGRQILPNADWIEVDQIMKMHRFMSTSQRTDVNASDDKWFVYADGPDVAGRARLYMYRSWTGQKMIELGVQGDPVHAGFATIIDITFETDESEQKMVVTEEKAKATAIEVCRWVLDVDLESSSRMDYCLKDLEGAMSELPKEPGRVTRSGPGRILMGPKPTRSRFELAEVIKERDQGPGST